MLGPGQEAKQYFEHPAVEAPAGNPKRANGLKMPLGNAYVKIRYESSSDA
jgi:hypothetical protein